MPLMAPMQYGMRRAGGIGLNPDDEESLVRSAARAGLSGISKVGNLLGLPGSMVRDVLTLNNPFDQLLTPLSDVNRTSGRDLLTQWGLTQPNKETGMGGWLSDPMEGVRDVAGFAAEVALDPLTYLGGIGMLGKGGKYADKAGLADDLTRVAAKKAAVPLGTIGRREASLTTSLDDLIAHAADPVAAAAKVKTAVDPTGIGRVLSPAERSAPVGGMLHFQPPFMDPVKTFGTGAKSQKVAQFLDKFSPNPFDLGSYFKNSTVGKSVGAMMDATRQGKLAPEVVPYAQSGFRGVTEGIQDAKGWGTEQADKLAKLGLTDSNAAKNIRSAAEGIPGIVDPSGVGAEIAAQRADDLSKLRSAGYGTRELDDVIESAFRQSGGQRKPGSSVPMSGVTAADVGREDVLKGYHKGTVGLETILTDPAIDANIKTIQSLVASARATGAVIPDSAIAKAVGADIMSRHGADIVEKFRARNVDGDFLFTKGATKTPSQIAKGTWTSPNTWERVDPATGAVVESLTAVERHRPTELAKYMIANPDLRQTGLFTNHPVVDAVRAKELTNTKLANADAAFGFLGAYAKPAGTHAKGEATEVGHVLKELGLTGDEAVANFARERGLPIPTTADEFKELRKMEISKSLADDYLKPRSEFKLPDAFDPLVKGVDSLTNLFKASVLTWPARYVRDWMTGQARNVEARMWDNGSAFAAHALLHGENVAGAAKFPEVVQWLAARGIPANDKNGTDALRQLYAKLGPGKAIQQADIAGAALPASYAGRLPELLDLIPGRTKSTVGQNVADVAKTLAGRTPNVEPWKMNPLKKDFYTQLWNIRGVGDRTETRMPLVAGGERIGKYTDDMNRLVPFINQLKQGVDPAAAMRKIMDAQVNYDPRTFTPTERALKKLLPFYSFCVPTDHEILTKRGWAKFDDLTLGEEVMSLNHETGDMEWVPLLAVNIFDHDGELVRHHRKKKTKTFSFEFTDNHRWPVLTEAGVAKWVSASGKDGKTIRKVKRTWRLGGDLRRHDRVPLTGNFVGPHDSVLCPRLARILGWVVTDGYYRWRGNSCEMIVYQSPNKFLAEIVELLGTQPRKPHPESGVVAVPVALADVKQLTKIFRKPEDFCGIVGLLSREAAEVMWDAMFKAEGSTSAKGNMHFAQEPTLNREILDGFQMLCYMTGRSCDVSKMGAYIKRSECTFIGRNLSRVHYQGQVWCPTTKHGTWVMRHDGATIITGNSSRQIPYVGKTLTTNPGGGMGQTIRAINAGRDQDSMLPEHIADTAAIPLPARVNDGTKRYLTGLGLMMEDPLQFVGGPRSGGLELLSRMNPLVKGPLEWATGQSFFQKGPNGGRSLDDLDPTLGRILANVTGQEKAVQTPQALEALLGNSPATRLLTSVRQATDKRKSWGDVLANLGTGVRVSDVSPAAQDAMLREWVQDAEKKVGGKTFLKTWIPDDVKAAMSPHERLAALKLEALMNTLNRRTKERRDAKGQK